MRLSHIKIILPNIERTALRWTVLESNQHLSYGTRGENRTHDALIKSQVLYQLSYADKNTRHIDTV